MSADFALALSSEMIWTGILIAAPILGLALLVGLLVSIFQVVTQIHQITPTILRQYLLYLEDTGHNEGGRHAGGVGIFYDRGWIADRDVGYRASMQRHAVDGHDDRVGCGDGISGVSSADSSSGIAGEYDPDSGVLQYASRFDNRHISYIF